MDRTVPPSAATDSMPRMSGLAVEAAAVDSASARLISATSSSRLRPPALGHIIGSFAIELLEYRPNRVRCALVERKTRRCVHIWFPKVFPARDLARSGTRSFSAAVQRNGQI